MKLQLKKYQQKFFLAMTDPDSTTLDHVWTLWQNLDDSASEELLDACIYFIEMFNFDIEELPDGLQEAVRDYMLDDEIIDCV